MPSYIRIVRVTYMEAQMNIVSTMTQFMAVLEGHHFAAMALIALVAVASRRPPKD